LHYWPYAQGGGAQAISADLQQGRYGKAEQLLELMKRVMTESKDDKRLASPATTLAQSRTNLSVFASWRLDLLSRLLLHEETEQPIKQEEDQDSADTAPTQLPRPEARQSTSQ
jgi:hypothetical protein